MPSDDLGERRVVAVADEPVEQLGVRGEATRDERLEEQGHRHAE